MVRRKKVLQEISLDSDGGEGGEEQQQQQQQQQQQPPPVVAEAATVDSSPAEQPQQPQQEVPSVPVTVDEQPPSRKRARSRTPAKVTPPSLNDKRRDALRKANEAKLRKKIEREIAEKERKRIEEERRMELKVQQMVQEQLKKFQAATYTPQRPAMSRRAIVKAPFQSPHKTVGHLHPAKHFENSHDDDDDDEEEDAVYDDDEYADDGGDDDDDDVVEQNIASRTLAKQPSLPDHQQRLFSQIFGK